MKVTLTIIAASAEAGRVTRQADVDNDRSRSQLGAMMNHYNPSFDERKYWTYGCNCLILRKFLFLDFTARCSFFCELSDFIR